MRYPFLLSIFIFILAGCKKDKFTTAPQLKYKGSNTKKLRIGETLTMTLGFSDLEGDLSDSLYLEKFEPRCANSRFKKMYKIPSFPSSKNQEGEFLVTLGYNDGFNVEVNAPRCGRNDTCIFRFVLKDKAQNKSDTVSSDPIIIYL